MVRIPSVFTLVLALIVAFLINLIPFGCWVLRNTVDIYNSSATSFLESLANIYLLFTDLSVFLVSSPLSLQKT